MCNCLFGVCLRRRFYCLFTAILVCGGLNTHAQAQTLPTPFIGIGAMVNLEEVLQTRLI